MSKGRVITVHVTPKWLGVILQHQIIWFRGHLVQISLKIEMHFATSLIYRFLSFDPSVVGRIILYK